MTANDAAPRTAAGRLHIKHWHPIGEGVTDMDLAYSILAIEAEAASPPLDVERLARALEHTSTGERPDGVPYNPTTRRLMAEEIAAAYAAQGEER